MHRRRIKTTSGGRGISEHLAPVDTLSKISIPELEVMGFSSIDQLCRFDCSDPDLMDHKFQR